MDTITIKTAYDSNGNKFWFAENEKEELFCFDYQGKSIFKGTFKESQNQSLSKLGQIMPPSSRFDSEKHLKNALNIHFKNLEKFSKEPEVVETLEF